MIVIVFSCLILFYPCHFSWKVLVWPLRYSPFLLKNGRTQSSSTSIPRDTAWILSLCELSLKGSGNLEISRHSHQVWSVTTKRSTYFTLMFLDTAEPDSISTNTVFIVHSFSAFIKPRKLSNLCWYSKTMLASFFLVSFIRDDRNMSFCRFVVTIENLQLRFTYQSFVHTSFHLRVTWVFWCIFYCF